MSDNSKLLDFAINIAKNAGLIHMDYFGKLSTIEKKTTKIDLVSKADIESNQYIVNEIQNKYPGHSILSEEMGKYSGDSNYEWVIDPLDGTTNFVHNLPIFACSIGLKLNGQTILGVVYNPAADKCFYAEKGKGAFLNKNQISPTSSKTLSESLLATGFPYEHDEKYDLLFKLFKEFYDRTRGLRRLGAASLDLCFVGMGRFDGFYEYGLKPWDICAGEIIAKESGAIVTDWNGKKELPKDGSRILAANKYIHGNMIKILSKEQYRLFID